MIIDGHAHITREQFGSAEQLLQDMEAASISKAVLVPGGMLDVRKMTHYISGKEMPVTTSPPNDIVLEAMQAYPDSFYGFCCIDPNRGSEAALEQLSTLKSQGFRGLKMAPLVHQFSLLGKVSKELAALCGDFGFPYYTHVVFHASASTAALGGLAKLFPQTNFIIGHMGFGPLDTEAIELAANLHNVYLETSTANPLALRIAVETAGPDKVFFGSEFPLSDPVVERSKIDRLILSDADKEKLYFNTIAALIQL